MSRFLASKNNYSITLLVLAIAAGLAICIYLFLKNIYNKDTIQLLMASFIPGIHSIFPDLIRRKLIFLLIPVFYTLPHLHFVLLL